MLQDLDFIPNIEVGDGPPPQAKDVASVATGVAHHWMAAQTGQTGVDDMVIGDTTTGSAAGLCHN